MENPFLEEHISMNRWLKVSHNHAIIALAGVFIMLSFFILMVGALMFVANSYYLPQFLFGMMFSGIGFYLLGMGLDAE